MSEEVEWWGWKMTDRGEEQMREDGWLGTELVFTYMKASFVQ